MTEYTTKAGKEIKINYAGFQDAMELKNAIGLELLKVNIDISDLLNKELDSQSINTFKNLILIIDTSKPVREALFKCLSRCLYNGFKIDYNTFNDQEAVAEYYNIMINCIKKQLHPFFQNQLSELLPLLNKAKDILKSLPVVEQKPIS
jgi:hypothetical protein